MNDLDDYWHRLVPRTYPIGGDLLRRVPVPVFFSSEKISVAVLPVGGGIDQLSVRAKGSLDSLEKPPYGFGLLLDADDGDVDDKWSNLTERLPDMDFGSAPGQVGQGTPLAGIFVLPDNESKGTLENLLICCADKVYPTLLTAARTFIDPLDPDDADVFRTSNERQDLSKPTGKNKAIVGCIANVLRPGKAVQVSIQDNQWLTHPEVESLPEVTSLIKFIDSIVT